MPEIYLLSIGMKVTEDNMPNHVKPVKGKKKGSKKVKAK